MSQDALADLRAQAAKLPRLPGVYLMRDSKGDVIYVGKAKNLRARVTTYFGAGDDRLQIEFLVQRIRQLEKIVTASEEQALILERDLIQRYKPRYNVRLKDDKAYLSVRVDPNQEWPRLELVRRVEKDGALYFGPYSYTYEVRALLEIIKRVVPLRTCANTIFYNRQRPCLEYQIKRCAGPCCLAVDREQYGEWVQEAIAILEGKVQRIIDKFSKDMERASSELRFEDAATIRDRIEILTQFSRGQSLMSGAADDRDVVAFYREERLATIAILHVRRGRVSDATNFAFDQLEVSDQTLVEATLEQFYTKGREIPEEILIPFDLPESSFTEETLTQRRGSTVAFSAPKRGLKARLLGLAELNAREHFVATFDAEQRYQEIARAMAKQFNLRQVPRRIECVDISNFQASDTVGAIVSFFDGARDKANYKRFRLERDAGPDDFKSMYEVVLRRLKHEEGNLPDLLIIDGGPGQLSSAIKAREDAGVAVDMVALAKLRTESSPRERNSTKKPERVYLEGASVPIPLDPQSELTQFLARVRDEAHRFVITFHRARRSKRVFRSVLDTISGVGPERRQRLLKVFGSVDRMRTVPVEELAKAGRMPKTLAQKILNTLKEPD